MPYDLNSHDGWHGFAATLGRRQREYADHATNPIVRRVVAEERAKRRYEKPCSRHRSNKSDPIAEP
jgi:hypothetical protein